MPVDLSLVIPAHNESSRLEMGFARLTAAMDVYDADSFEVIIVDDGSNDGTGRRAADLYAAIPRHLVVRQETNRGKGAAVRLGISVATGSKIVVCDADMAINPSHLPDVLTALDHTPLAFGSRTRDGAIRYDSWVRTRTGVIFNQLVRRAVHTEIRDTQCGFKGFTAGAARLLGLLGLIDGFAYDVEVLFLADQLDLEVTSVPVTWDDIEGSSVHLLRDSRRMVRDIFGLKRTTYECPVVTTTSDVDVAVVRDVARASRVSGLVIARSANDALVVLPRDGALVGVDMAKAVQGQLGVAGLGQLRGRELEAV